MRFVRSLVALLVVVAVSFGALAAVPPPAQAAAASGSTSSSSGVLYDTCLGHAYHYSLNLPAGWTYWDLDVELIAPDGTSASSDFLSYYLGNSPSGSSTFLFCGYEMPGRYTVTASGEWDDSDYNSHTFTLPNSSFVMRSPRSRTQLRVSDRTPRKGQIVRFRITVTDERPRGYFRTQYARVVLQHKVGSRWVAYRWSRTTTNNRGVVTVRARFRGKPVKVRARTSPDGYTASQSRVVRIRR